MIDLTVDANQRVASYHGHVIISTRRGVSIVCTQCGCLRNMFPFDQAGSCGILQTGQMFQHCYCTQALHEQYPLQVMPR